MAHNRINEPAAVASHAGGAVSAQVPRPPNEGRTAPTNIDWASRPGLDARLKELHLRGDSFKQIADALSIEFATAITRNACIGRAQRLKLPWPERPAKFRKKVTEAPLPPLGKRQPPVQRAAPMQRTTPLQAVKAAVVEALYLTFAELRPRQCHFPYGEHAPFLFCGLPTAHNCSWCAFHSHFIAKERAR